MLSRLPDYHIHTALCGHAEGMPLAYAEAAFRQGLPEIGFADHLPAGPGFAPVHAMALREMETYVAEVESARQAFPDLTIRLGVEADLYPGFEAHLEALRRRFPIEFVIGSAHYIYDYFLFSPQPPRWKPVQIGRAIGDCFDLMVQGVHSGLVDVLGHIDGIKWLFPHEMARIETEAYTLLQTAARAGVAMELNTSGIRKKPGQPYPELPLLRHAADLGVAVVTGSDAHAPHQVGSHFDHAQALFRSANLTSDVLTSTGLRAFVSRAV